MNRLPKGFSPPELVFAIAVLVFFASASIALLSAIHRSALADEARGTPAEAAGGGAR